MTRSSSDITKAIAELTTISLERALSTLAGLLQVDVELAPTDVFFFEDTRALGREVESFSRSGRITQVSQHFWGGLKGEAVLLVSDQDSRLLISTFLEKSGYQTDMEIGKLDLEVLLEVGNLIIGVCLGQLVDFMQARLWFNFPQIRVEDSTDGTFQLGFISHTRQALNVRTSFRIGAKREQVINFLLFVFLSEAELARLRAAVDDFCARMSLDQMGESLDDIELDEIEF